MCSKCVTKLTNNFTHHSAPNGREISFKKITTTQQFPQTPMPDAIKYAFVCVPQKKEKKTQNRKFPAQPLVSSSVWKANFSMNKYIIGKKRARNKRHGGKMSV